MRALLVGVALVVTLTGCGSGGGYEEDTTPNYTPETTTEQSDQVGGLSVFADCDGTTRVYEGDGIFAVPNSPECGGIPR